MKAYIYLFIPSIFIFSCSNESIPPSDPAPKTEETEFVPTLEYKLVNTFPHDTLSFTQGFLFHQGKLFESTGSPENIPETHSVLGIVDLKTGKINKKAELEKEYFGEGITILNDKLYQLTYKHQVGFVYDVANFKRIGKFSFNNKEGWGITTDGKNLIMSDGTSDLTFLDPATLTPLRTVNVTNGGYPEDDLNELEYIRGFIYANVWTKNYIVKIDPATGKVVALLNLSTLTEDALKKNQNAEVLNGIAYDSISDKVYVTGKLWPNIYEIDFPH
jgi:glutamine cyclotransferase